MSDPAPIDLLELLEQVRSGRPLVDVLLELTSDAERDALDRCAVPRHFDRAVLELACADLDADTRLPFEQLVARPEIEELSPGLYRMRGEPRQARWERWISGSKPPWLGPASQRLVDHYQSADTTDDLEALYHDFVVKPARATARLDELFLAADAVFDLSSCEDLIDVAQERVALAPALADTIDRLKAYLRARTLWTDDWYRTESFVPPASSLEVFKRFLAEGGPRVLTVRAADGTGKTMHLQWLVARHCAPAPEPWLCARIDFEDIGDPLLAVQEPWLLLLELARQFAIQLPGRVLEPLLADFGAHAARLIWRNAGGRDTLVAGSPETAAARERLAENLRRRFYSELKRASSLPILVTVDSIDVALLAEPERQTAARITPLSSELARLLKELPRARVVLARRDDPDIPLPAIDPSIPMALLQPAPLTPDEASEYLLGRRGLRLAPDVEEACLAAVGGMPIRLAIIADALARRPEVSAAEIDAAAQADDLYLVRMALDRLEPPELRWALQYGVVPRLFEVEFLREVMWPVMSEDREPRENVNALWRELRDVAAESPWINRVGPGALRFHATFAQQLRRVLREFPVYLRLHADAEDWFMRRASDEPERWGTWTAEALYHRFARDPEDAVGFWRELMGAAEHRDARHATDLARELLRLADADGERRLSGKVIAEAWLARAGANVRLAREAPGVPRGHDGWKRARLALDEARRHEPPDGRWFEARSTEIEAALLAHDHSEHQAIALLRGVRSRSGSAAERLPLTVELAHVLETVTPDDTSEYHEALRLAVANPDAHPTWVTVARRLARHLASRDRYRSAIKLFDAALERAEPGTRTEQQLRLLRAEACMASGAPSGAASALEPLARLDGRMGHRAAIAEARAALSAWRPAEALELLNGRATALEQDRGDADPAEHAVRIADLRELRGQVRSHFLDVRDALDDLEAAALAFESAGLSTRARGCYVRIAELQLRGIHDVRAAGLTLDRIDGVHAESESFDWVGVRLRRIEWAGRMQSGTGARDELDALVEDLRAHAAPPRCFVAAAIEGLALDDQRDPSDHLRLMVEQLKRIESAGARLTLLGQLYRCAPVHCEDTALLRHLDQLARPVAVTGVDARDRAILELSAAELARVCGRRTAAQRRLGAAFEAFVATGTDAYVDRRLLQAASRFDAKAATETVTKLAADDASDSHPTLNAALLIAGAKQILGEAQREGLAETLLQRAESLLDRSTSFGGHWAAAVHEARATLASQRDDEQQARVHVTQAKALNAQLADGREHNGGHGPGADAPSARSALVVTFARVPDGLRVQAELPDGTRHKWTETDRLGELLAKPDRAPVEALVEWLVNDYGEWLLAALPALIPPGVAEAGGPRLDLLIRSVDRRVQALPWELAVASAPAALRERLGAVERSAPGIDAPPASASIPHRRVTVLVPAAGDPGTGVPAAERYRAAGWEVRTCDSFEAGELQGALRDFEPAVVHARCPLVYSGGTAMLDQNRRGGRSGAWRPERELLPATRLACALPSGPIETPVFVLDPPATPSEPEFVRQLLMRNLLAAELHGLRGVPVIAAGLCPPAIADPLADALIEALDPPADIRAAGALAREHEPMAAARAGADRLSALAVFSARSAR